MKLLDKYFFYLGSRSKRNLHYLRKRSLEKKGDYSIYLVVGVKVLVDTFVNNEILILRDIGLRMENYVWEKWRFHILYSWNKIPEKIKSWTLKLWTL